MHYFSRLEVAGIVGALALLVVGVSLAVVPPDAPDAPRSRVDGVFKAASPKPSDAPAAVPSASAPAAASPAPPPAAPALTASGPTRLQPWQTYDFNVTVSATGTHSVDISWSGAAMGNWTWQRLAGHCELTPSRDRLSGTTMDTVVVQLELTPSGAPGGQLVIEGSLDGGPAYALAVVTVG